MSQATDQRDLISPSASVSFRSIATFIAKLLWESDQSKVKWRLIFALLMTFCAKGFAVSGPIFIGEAVNSLSTGEQASDAHLTMFVILTAIWALFRYLSLGGPYIRDYFFAKVSQQAQRLVASRFFTHILTLSLSFHHTKRTGALQRVMERSSRAVDFLLRFLCFNIVPTIIELVVAAVILAWKYGLLFSLIAIIAVTSYIFFTVKVTEWRVKHRRAMNQSDQYAFGRAVDALGNIETVKAFAAEKNESEIVDKALQRYANASEKSTQSLALLNAGQALITTAGLAAIAILAGVEVHAQRMEIGDILAVVLILNNLYQPLNILGWAWREIRQSVVDMEKLFELNRLSPSVVDPFEPNKRPDPPFGLKFENVAFAHESRTNTLTALDLTIENGSFIGIAGSSGSGKSTLLRLLLRFYDPTKGQILLNDTDIRTLKQSDLRELIGFVPQDVILFNDSLGENIRYANPTANEKDLLSTIAKSGLSDLVDSLPKGLDTLVGERGVKLSGGERQRVGLARALLKDPQILLLDEATSALDSKTEQQVQKSLIEATKGRTTIAVAHRLSTIAQADKIIILDEGQIIQKGTHAELVAMEGLYQEMWTKQSMEQKHSQSEKITLQ